MLAIHLRYGTAHRLGTVDHEQTWHTGIHPTLHQAVEQILHHRRVLAAAARQPQQVLLTTVVESHRRHHVMPRHFDAVDVHAHNVHIVEAALHELTQARRAGLLQRPRYTGLGNARTSRHLRQHALVFARGHPRDQDLAHAPSQSAVLLQLLIERYGHLTPATTARAKSGLLHLEPPLEQTHLSALAAMPQHLPAVTSRALLTGDAARRQLQQQLHQRTPRLVHHRGDALLAALDQ